MEKKKLSMNLNKKYLCIIPARAGSKGIKNKNIKKINGMPLVEHTIKFTKKIENYFDILVSSNSNKVLKIAKKYKSIHTNFRPERLCRDKSLTINVVKYELKRMEKKLNKKYFAILLLQPTAPFREKKDIQLAIKKIKSKKYDSVVSIKDVEGFHPLRMKIKKKNFIINYSNEKKENMKPRQNLPKVFIRSGSIYMIKRRTLIKNNSLVGRKVFGLEQKGKKVINIDNSLDLLIAQKIAKKIM
jgi:CMP-N,N'-diacetyllegionaminic acid synthase